MPDPIIAFDVAARSPFANVSVISPFGGSLIEITILNLIAFPPHLLLAKSETIETDLLENIADLSWTLGFEIELANYVSKKYRIIC